MRIDIREDLEAAARGELYHNGHYVLLVSKDLVEKMGGKTSGPVTLQFLVHEGSAIIDVAVTDLEPGGPLDGE